MKRSLNDVDLAAIRDLLDKNLDKRLDFENFRELVRSEVGDVLDEKLDEKLSHLPSKKEFFDKMDA